MLREVNHNLRGRLRAGKVRIYFLIRAERTTTARQHDAPMTDPCQPRDTFRNGPATPVRDATAPPAPRPTHLGGPGLAASTVTDNAILRHP